jgi:hypothetical protein
MRNGSPVRALMLGIADVVRSPVLLLGVAIVTLAIAVPFAAVVESRLQQSLSVQPQISLAETEINPEWWMEFREHARGLDATFTPAVLGFAATLDGISHVLDGERIPAGIVLPLILSIVAWAFLWGGVLARFQAGRGIGAGGFVKSGLSQLARFVSIAVAASIANVILYFTVHRLLFGPVYSTVAGLTSTERDAFFVRVLLYAIFFSTIGLVSLVADYARVAAVAGGSPSIGAAIRASIAFIRARLGAVITLFVLTGLIFVAVTIAYGTLEVVGGSQIGGWRAIAIGQAYVFVRLAIRLTFAASELRLFNASHAAAAE